MKILFISTWFPFPPDVGSRIRVNYLLRALAERHRVHLIAFLPDSASHCEGPQPRSNPGLAQEIASQTALAMTRLNEWGVEVDVVRRDPFWRDPVKARLAYLSPLPRDAVAGHSPELAALVRRAAECERYDLAIASASEVIPYAQLVPGPRLLEEHNFMTGWMAEKHRAERFLPRRALRWLTWQKSLRYERRLYPRFDAITMVSDADRRAVEAAIPAVVGRVAVIPNGVDTARNRPGLAEPEPGTLVFNGSLTYTANADAMRYFCGEILPLVRAAVPAVRLRITGRYDGVDLTGIAEPQEAGDRGQEAGDRGQETGVRGQEAGGRGQGSLVSHQPSSFILHPSSFRLPPSSFILHPSSFRLPSSSFILHPSSLVQLTGYLDDVRPIVAGSWACVVPLRQGGGTRLKILEALALGVPVVATSKGAEGLDVTHEHDILIADDPAEFARQTIRLLGDGALRARLAANGRALVEAQYGWDRIGAAFCELVERVAAERESGRTGEGEKGRDGERLLVKRECAGGD